MAQNSFKHGLERHFNAEQLNLLENATIGIAGLGGLGSNAAMLLARSGIENFVVADHDIVESSNLNRQHYWPRQLGMAKTDALAEHLRELNPDIRLKAMQIELNRENLPEILPLAPIWVEALDRAEIKSMFVETALLAGRRVVSASGLAGFGGAPMRKRKLGNLTIVGDFVSETGVAPPLAPRVTQAAALLADCALEFILPPGARNP